MSAIHHAASEGYSSAADRYASGRPDYPLAVAAWLRAVVGLNENATVLDLGAGTGKFLPILRRTGARIIALEPVPAMRAQLAARNPDVEVLAGTAETIPLPDEALDAVICAQSFHWFANAVALSNIRRVLKRQGVLGLVWNVRDERVDWVARLSSLTYAYEGDAPRYSSGAWRLAFPVHGLTLFDQRQFDNVHVGPPEQVIVDRTLSVSFIAALPQGERDKVAGEVRALIAAEPALAGRGTVSFSYVTDVFAYRKVA